MVVYLIWIWWLSIGIGSLISICGIGYALVEALKGIQFRLTVALSLNLPVFFFSIAAR